MPSHTPGRAHRSVLRLQPNRRQLTVGYSILALLFSVVVAVGATFWDRPWPLGDPPLVVSPSGARLILLAALLLFGLSIAAAAHNGARWRAERRTEKLLT